MEATKGKPKRRLWCASIWLFDVYLNLFAAASQARKGFEECNNLHATSAILPRAASGLSAASTATGGMISRAQSSSSDALFDYRGGQSQFDELHAGVASSFLSSGSSTTPALISSTLLDPSDLAVLSLKDGKELKKQQPEAEPVTRSDADVVAADGGQEDADRVLFEEENTGGRGRVSVLERKGSSHKQDHGEVMSQTQMKVVKDRNSTSTEAPSTTTAVAVVTFSPAPASPPSVPAFVDYLQRDPCYRKCTVGRDGTCGPKAPQPLLTWPLQHQSPSSEWKEEERYCKFRCVPALPEVEAVAAPRFRSSGAAAAAIVQHKVKVSLASVLAPPVDHVAAAGGPQADVDVGRPKEAGDPYSGMISTHLLEKAKAACVLPLLADTEVMAKRTAKSRAMVSVSATIEKGNRPDVFVHELGFGAFGAVWSVAVGVRSPTVYVESFAVKRWPIPMHLFYLSVVSGQNSAEPRQLMRTADSLTDVLRNVREAALLRFLPPHRNLLEFRGIRLHAWTLPRGAVSVDVLLNEEERDLKSLLLDSQYYTQGLTLKQKWQAFLQFGRDIIAGIMHLHKNGVVHRDLKPANILLKRKRRAPPAEHDEQQGVKVASEIRTGQTQSEAEGRGPAASTRSIKTSGSASTAGSGSDSTPGPSAGFAIASPPASLPQDVPELLRMQLVIADLGIAQVNRVKQEMLYPAACPCGPSPPCATNDRQSGRAAAADVARPFADGTGAPPAPPPSSSPFASFLKSYLQRRPRRETVATRNREGGRREGGPGLARGRDFDPFDDEYEHMMTRRRNNSNAGMNSGNSGLWSSALASDGTGAGASSTSASRFYVAPRGMVPRIASPYSRSASAASRQVNHLTESLLALATQSHSLSQLQQSSPAPELDSASAAPDESETRETGPAAPARRIMHEAIAPSFTIPLSGLCMVQTAPYRAPEVRTAHCPDAPPHLTSTIDSWSIALVFLDILFALFPEQLDERQRRGSDRAGFQRHVDEDEDAETETEQTIFTTHMWGKFRRILPSDDSSAKHWARQIATSPREKNYLQQKFLEPLRSALLTATDGVDEAEYAAVANVLDAALRRVPNDRASAGWMADRWPGFPKAAPQQPVSPPASTVQASTAPAQQHLRPAEQRRRQEVFTELRHVETSLEQVGGRLMGVPRGYRGDPGEERAMERQLERTSARLYRVLLGMFVDQFDVVEAKDSPPQLMKKNAEDPAESAGSNTAARAAGGQSRRWSRDATPPRRASTCARLGECLKFFKRTDVEAPDVEVNRPE